MIKYTLVIPFYKNEQYIDYFIAWYQSNPLERNLIKRVVIINDCPEGDSDYLIKRCNENDFELIENQINLGYLQSANTAINLAINNKSHLILLNSDAIPHANFISELANCFSLDSNLGIVAPRSNNATICNLYIQPRYFDEKVGLDEFIEDFDRFKRMVPEITYVPTATGFCFCVRHDVLEIFGGFDPAYGPGYEEENDYCMRVSERGIRVGIANHAFVAHMEGKSFDLTLTREAVKSGNTKIIAERYPYYYDLIANYARSLDACCLRKVSASLETEGRMLIDARALSPIFNGTNKLIVEFIRAMSALGYKFDTLASEEAIEFHELGDLTNLVKSDDLAEVYFLGIRLGQPFDHSTLFLIPAHSVSAVCIFFDVIAHDCPQLLSQNPQLESIWTRLPYLYSEVSFISRYAKEQFISKFGYGSAKMDDALLPIIIDSAIRPGLDSFDHEVVLVIGNKFKHKAVDIAISELREVDNRIYYVLGEGIETTRLDVHVLQPGLVEESKMKAIMQASEFIVFPTFSEGFGFPILEALQYRKKIYCRLLPPFLEIYDALENDLKGLIHFVQNFRVLDEISTKLNIKVDSKTTNTFDSYMDYVSHVIKMATATSGPDIYQRMKSRELFMRGSSGKRQVTIVILFAIYRAIKKIPYLKKISSFFVRRINI